jgi:hypothetical protein
MCRPRAAWCESGEAGDPAAPGSGHGRTEGAGAPVPRWVRSGAGTLAPGVPALPFTAAGSGSTAVIAAAPVGTGGPGDAVTGTGAGTGAGAVAGAGAGRGAGADAGAGGAAAGGAAAGGAAAGGAAAGGAAAGGAAAGGAAAGGAAAAGSATPDCGTATTGIGAGSSRGVVVASARAWRSLSYAAGSRLRTTPTTRAPARSSRPTASVRWRCRVRVTSTTRRTPSVWAASVGPSGLAVSGPGATTTTSYRARASSSSPDIAFDASGSLSATSGGPAVSTVTGRAPSGRGVHVTAASSSVRPPPRTVDRPSLACRPNSRSSDGWSRSASTRRTRRSAFERATARAKLAAVTVAPSPPPGEVTRRQSRGSASGPARFDCRKR